ncbi:MAG TPA: ABC transporter substrate-binding protein [Streptosporangiaceae bacterium]|nr:ABC transporter substrate-binding protein [Streptosporangiaceae bacterium]
MKVPHTPASRLGSASRRHASRRRLLAAGAAVTALALSACGSSSGSGSGSGGSGSNAWATVNVGIALSPPKAIFMGAYVAQAKGYFAKEHLNIKFISMPNGLQTELGTTAGSIDFGFSSATDSIEAAAQHAPIHAIWSYGTKLDTQCIGAPGIKSARGLVGKPVGSTGTDGFSITLLQACLEPAGVHLSQIKPINMTRSEFVPAMVAKKIDAAVFHADDAYVITHQLTGSSVLESEYQAIPQWWYGGVSMLDSYGKAHKDVVVRFLTAMMLADRWMNNPANNSALVSLAAKTTQEDPAAVAYAIKFLRDSGTWPNGAGLSPSQVNYTAGILAKYKDIPSQPTFSQIVDPSYANAAAAKLGSS